MQLLLQMKEEEWETVITDNSMKKFSINGIRKMGLEEEMEGSHGWPGLILPLPDVAHVVLDGLTGALCRRPLFPGLTFVIFQGVVWSHAWRIKILTKSNSNISSHLSSCCHCGLRIGKRDLFSWLCSSQSCVLVEALAHWFYHDSLKYFPRHTS